MTRDTYTHFIREGGRGRLGYPATALLEAIVTKAEEMNYPEYVELSVADVKYWCKFSDNAQAFEARKKLMREGLIKAYDKKDKNVGLFYLNYDR